MRRPIAWMAWVALAGLMTSCVEAPPFYYAEQITGRDFVPTTDTMGAHPDQTVLIDPENPFVDAAIGPETQWNVEGYGDPVAAFYCWATMLAYAPTGERQYYTALNLQRIHTLGRASEDDLPAVRDLAIAAYQNVLDQFPGSVTFDASGSTAFNLVTPSYLGIVALGGAPTGGWSLVNTEDGNVVAVKTADPPPPPVAEEDEE